MLPVFIYHEVDQKQTFGAGKKQPYVEMTVKQAEKYNEDVILLGDSYNIKYAKYGELASVYENTKWFEFEKVFVNLTTDYPDAWAKGFFKRFFLVEDYLKRHDINECVILDSDILTYVDYEKYFSDKECDVSLCVFPRQSIAQLPYENELRMLASIHVSYFTLKALSDFTDFCIDQYKDIRGMIKEKWEAHQKYNLPGGVTEMSLLYLWIKSNPELRVYNLLQEHSGTVFDWTSLAPAGWKSEDEFEFDKYHNIKVISYKEGSPYFLRTDGSKVKALAVHFGGKTKTFMADYYQYGRIGMSSNIKWFMVRVRAILSVIKHRII